MRAFEDYRFKDEAQQQSLVTEVSCRVLEASKKDLERTEAKRLIRQNYSHPFCQRANLLRGLGYEQTNINFYLIAEVKAKSVLIQEIGKNIDKYTGHMSAFISPDIDNKIGNPILKKIQFYLNSFNQPVFYLASERRCISLLRPESKLTCSWYA